MDIQTNYRPIDTEYMKSSQIKAGDTPKTNSAFLPTYIGQLTEKSIENTKALLEDAGI